MRWFRVGEITITFVLRSYFIIFLLHSLSQALNIPGAISRPDTTGLDQITLGPDPT